MCPFFKDSKFTFMALEMNTKFSCCVLWNQTLCPAYNHSLEIWSIPVTSVLVNLCQKLLFFASTNPQYDNRKFIELQVQYMKIPSSNLGRIFCVQKLLLTFRTIFVHNMFSQCSAKKELLTKI